MTAADDAGSSTLSPSQAEMQRGVINSHLDGTVDEVDDEPVKPGRPFGRHLGQINGRGGGAKGAHSSGGFLGQINGGSPR